MAKLKWGGGHDSQARPWFTAYTAEGWVYYVEHGAMPRAGYVVRRSDNGGALIKRGVQSGLWAELAKGVRSPAAAKKIAAQDYAHLTGDFANNPSLVVLGNPPLKLSKAAARGAAAGGRVFAREVLELRYIHQEDGKAYKHTFDKGVQAVALPDGSVRLVNPRKPIWGDY